MAVKIKVIEDDPYEKGFRAALNLGHTVGHAVELGSKFQLRHGEAVAIGMVSEVKYAERIGVAPSGLCESIHLSLSSLGLTLGSAGCSTRDTIIRAIRLLKYM